MHTVNFRKMAEDYEIVAKAIRYLEEQHPKQPQLSEVAAYLGMSEFHFQRLFTSWVGISPKRFLQCLTLDYARKVLASSQSLMLTAFQAGLSGPGRLHDLFLTCEAVTPGEFRRRGAGLTVRYAFHPTPFGEALIAMTQKGICNLQFVDAHGRDAALERLARQWARANLLEDQDAIAQIVPRIFSNLPVTAGIPLKLHILGTNFQIKVWEALLRIPAGSMVSYQDVAIFIGLPTSVRAVAQAVARNPVAVLIPCHRVLRKSGEIGGYRWGTTRKKALLGWELAHLE